MKKTTPSLEGIKRAIESIEMSEEWRKKARLHYINTYRESREGKGRNKGVLTSAKHHLNKGILRGYNNEIGRTHRVPNVGKAESISLPPV